MLVALLALALACALAATAVAKLGPNPADDPRLIDHRIEGYDYDPAKHCDKHMPPGTRALKKWLGRHTRGEFWGSYRCEKLSAHSYSLHSENRAIDWAMDAKDRDQKRQAMKLIRKRLLATDERGNDNALARRMGVQGIIFDCKAWWGGDGGLGEYSYCYDRHGHRKHGLDPTAAHMNHIHIELNWAGARKKTFFWRSPLARR